MNYIPRDLASQVSKQLYWHLAEEMHERPSNEGGALQQLSSSYRSAI
jgi:hypothetical protein